MAFQKMILLAVLFVGLSLAEVPQPKCGLNEQWVQCATCERTCANPNPFCTYECKPPRCMCKEGYLRNSEGICIPGDSCYAQNAPSVSAQSCGINEQWVQCATCERTCANPNPFCTYECKPARCMCKNGYLRNSKGVCIPQNTCGAQNVPSVPAQTCGKNEQWVQCASCERTCANPNPFCTYECKPARCMCKNGYLRNSKGACIPQNTCGIQNVPSQPSHACGIHERWVECATCERSCQNPNPICTYECKPARCMCDAGYVRGYFGVCIPEAACGLQPSSSR
uniref:TIL domain-containing protein n=1 Tax=Steinernema glaseri TaxID=37863 RepID=A0A1I7Z0X9_9BILA